MLIASISIFIIYYILMINYYVNSNVISISLNAQNDVANLKHFWKSTGFSPLGNMTLQKFILSTDEKINLAFIGALPNNAISHVRIHWLINLIRINASNQYDYKYLDELIFWMREQHLYPRFELMGTPINIYGKQYFNKSYTFWNYITTDIINHYDTFFGRQELSKWKFETWNEPDLRGYNILNFTLAEYLDYVRAVSNAIRAYDEANIKLGGPAGLFKQESKHPLCWGLLEYCNNVISNTGCPIDYITFHKKGNASSKKILQEDLELLDVFSEKFPKLHKMPIANDEADILTNWSRDEEWRGDVRYAAMIANVIINHYKEIIVKRKIQIEVLSNDNAFLNYHPFYFTQRTLLARFQMNNTRPPHVQFVPKPSYAVMGLLSLLGDRYLPTIEPQSTRSNSSSSSIASALAIRRYADLLTVLATKERNDNSCHVATIISFCNDTVENSDVKTKVAIKFNNFPMDNCFYVIYILDNQRTNPFKEWKSAGSPVFPNRTTRNKMRNVQGPYRKHRPTHFSNTTLNIKLTLTLPTVALINICCRGLSDSPGSVTDLQVLNVTKNEVLLIWKDNKVKSKCIRSYEVEFQYSCSDLLSPSQFKLLRRPDSIYLSYQHRYVSPPPLFSARPGLLQSSDTDGSDVVTPQQTDDAGNCKRVYRVRPVDYWKRKGPYSKIVDI